MHYLRHLAHFQEAKADKTEPIEVTAEELTRIAAAHAKPGRKPLDVGKIARALGSDVLIGGKKYRVKG